MTVDLNTHYTLVTDLVTRTIEDELVIVPLSSGVSDLDGEMFSLNKTGIMIWKKLDGSIPLKEVIQDIADDFNAPYEQIKKDVIKLVDDLLKKKLIEKNNL
jgi:hypothetical protein